MNNQPISLLDLSKQAIIPIITAVGLLLAVAVGWVWFGLEMAVVVLLGPSGAFKTRWSSTRNCSVAGRIRWLFHHLRPNVHSYILKDDLGGTPHPLSPRGHSAFSARIELLEVAARMRELSGGKPVGLKQSIGQPHEPFAIIKAIRGAR
ncbi:hypothetical protein V1T76_28060 [Roseibium sp. FZY0029]|uniref:hypothetical protein n=1 Tax=Roseibium sp. FZY0029 TaxID=3116647 RepID=UPI002EA099E0|nr:hypothetical protein [Roseibium sp. FZY0029]